MPTMEAAIVICGIEGGNYKVARMVIDAGLRQVA